MATELLERNLAMSGILSEQQVPGAIPLRDVIRALNRAKVSYVLVGAHGLATWRGKPRATVDVDVVVAARHLKKAKEALLRSFPKLEAVDLAVVIRLRVRGTDDVVVDLMKPTQQPYREVFKHTREVVLEEESVRIPTLEMAVVMKFSAIASGNRQQEDKHQDAHDFILMVKNHPELDEQKLAELASLVYDDGGRDVLTMVGKVRSGEMLQL